MEMNQNLQQQNQQEIKNNIKQELLELGFNESDIIQALYMSSDKEEVINLILSFQEFNNNQNQQQQPQQNNNLPMQQQQQQQQQQQVDSQTLFNSLQQQLLQQFGAGYEQKQYKMVIVVRTDLKMGTGKIASQTGHAVLGAYKQMIENLDKGNFKQCLDEWEDQGQAKIVLKVSSQQELLELYQKAENSGINTCYIQDAGRTQIEPGSITVCAFGPAAAEDIDKITSHLKLL